MEPVAILIGTVIAILAGAFIVRPLSAYRPERLREVDRERSTLQAEQDRILALIEELEMDHAIGKILDEDYEVERSRLLQQGAKNLKKLDELQIDTVPEDVQGRRSLEDELEASVATLREKKLGKGQSFCGNCEAKVLVGDRFCVVCGEKLSPQEVRG